jgi:hypothetical protein
MMSEAKEIAVNSSDDVKYCVAAFLDLQGFSSHLEVSSDIRTRIGQQAITRLEVLENGLDFLRNEQRKISLNFPNQRINDAIILTMDLHDALLPDIGQTFRAGLSEPEWERLYDIKMTRLDTFPIQHGDSGQEFEEKYQKKRKEYTSSLLKFIGLISRLHQRVSYKDYDNNFAGAKTIVSTGFRRRFFSSDGSEDYFSANFAFSNAYKAQESLHGAGLFLDNHIFEMMDAGSPVMNIARFACVSYERPVYSPLRDDTEPNPKIVQSGPIPVPLFRKKYYFRRVNVAPLTYLQFVDELEASGDIFESIIDSINADNISDRLKSGERFNILKLPYDLGKKQLEKFGRQFEHPQMPKCPGCGAEVVTNARYCVECGEPIPTALAVLKSRHE